MFNLAQEVNTSLCCNLSVQTKWQNFLFKVCSELNRGQNNKDQCLMVYECVFDGRKQSSSGIIGFGSNLEILRFNPEAAEYIYIQLPLK